MSPFFRFVPIGQRDALAEWQIAGTTATFTGTDRSTVLMAAGSPLGLACRDSDPRSGNIPVDDACRRDDILRTSHAERAGRGTVPAQPLQGRESGVAFDDRHEK